jgi:hypothetical protein
MEVRFNVNLVELKQACGRLVARLADESDGDPDYVAFTATGSTLEIRTGTSSEALPTTIYQSGRALMPRRVFCCLVNALRYCRGKTVEFDFSAGTVTLSGRTQIRHPRIDIRNGNPKSGTVSDLQEDSE